jgi:hypothetical protein
MDELEEQLAAYRRRKKRRKQRKVVAILGFLAITTGLAWFFESQATTTIIVSRYANISAAEDEPSLNAAGLTRALELERVLGDVDVVAGIDAIFIAPNKRAIETSAPLAKRNGAPVHTVDNPADAEALVARILREYKGKIILLITEPELLQPVIAEMHGSKKLPVINHGEYDNLYIVSIPWFGKVKTLRLRYGMPYSPDNASGSKP